MNAPRFEVVQGSMVRVVETSPSPRLEQLRAKARALGISADIVESANASVLSMSVYEGEPGASRHFGIINVWPATEDSDERWHLSASCDVMVGLAMQADWLPVAAAKVREVATQLMAVAL